MKRKIFILTLFFITLSVVSSNLVLAEDLIPKENEATRKWGYVNKRGKIVIPFKYYTAGNFSEGLARVDLDGKWGFIDKNGNDVIPLKYDGAIDFSEGLAGVELHVEFDSKWGFINKMGSEVIPFKYRSVSHFSEGLARVSKTYIKNYGFIDKKGNEVIPIKYDDAGNFSEGVVSVLLNGKWGFIDKNGNKVIPFKYDQLWWISDHDIAKVTMDGKYGFVDKTGKELLPPKYDWVDERDTGKTQTEVWKDGKEGIIDKTVKIISPLKYKNRKIETVWESILLSNINQINDYHSGIGNASTSGNFNINRPYLIIKIKDKEKKDADIYYYSEGDFNKQSIAGLKTLIVNYDTLEDSGSYFGSLVGVMASFGATIVYFDMASKECIGYDKMQGPKLPKRTRKLGNLYIPREKILRQVKSHLTKSGH